MDDVRGILQEELQHVVGRLRDLGGAFMVDDGSGVLDDDDEVIKRLPDEKAQNVVRDFRPQGRIGARIALAKRDGVRSLGQLTG